MRKELNRLEIGGVILAGGQAHRLGGIAKGTIDIDKGVTIIEQLIKELNMAGINNVVISSNDSKPYNYFDIKIISDVRPGLGPIGGIEAGLAYFTGQTDAVMFIPCDMPNITAKEMLVLKETFFETRVPVVFAETTGFFWHPLCAVVHNDLKEEISSAIDRGQRKIRDLWQQVNAIRVQFADETAFFNINSSTDLDNWRKTKK